MPRPSHTLEIDRWLTIFTTDVAPHFRWQCMVGGQIRTVNVSLGHSQFCPLQAALCLGQGTILSMRAAHTLADSSDNWLDVGQSCGAAWVRTRLLTACGLHEQGTAPCSP